MDKIVDDLISAIDAAAATFDRRGSAMKERELEMALETALRALGRQPIRQRTIRLERAWSGRVGGVDLALDDPDGLGLIELKWDPRTLAACAWDSVKLAAALEAGEGSRAFLAAASPLVDDLRGDELLNSSIIRPDELRRSYEKEFDFWKGDVQNHPVLVPAAWQIDFLHAATFRLNGSPWQIRLVEVTLTKAELVPFE